MSDWLDWIDQFLDYTEGIPSPRIFRLWGAISAVSGALERRVWAGTAGDILYPNMFVVLVSPPGIGKTQVVKRVQKLWVEVPGFHVAPSSVTKASLIDALAEADTKKIYPEGLVEYHSLLIAAGELGVFISAHDLEFLSVLNDIYDNPESYRETRRTNKMKLEIRKPQVNILAGTQPGFLGSLLPDEAWTMGFTSRLIMIYSTTAPKLDLFNTPQHRSMVPLLTGLKAIAELHGAAMWTPEARTLMQSWYSAGCPPTPTHSKLAHYNTRRHLHALKLGIISAVSRTGGIVVEARDIQRAQDWMLQAEEVMPDVFRDMVGKSDGQVMEELHHSIWSIWARTKKPVPETILWSFLKHRVPGEKIPRIIEAMDKSGMMLRDATTGGDWIPQPKHEHGAE